MPRLTKKQVAAGIAALIAASWLIPVYGEICEKNANTGQKDCAAYHISTVILWHIGEILNYYGVAITAVATGVIGLFTYTLYKTTAVQARLTRDSIDLARQEFIATHRPKIILRDAWAIPADGVAVTVMLTFVNQGIAKAWITESAITVEFFERSGALFLSPDPIHRMDLASPNDFVGGQVRNFTFTSRSLVWDHRMTATYYVPDDLGVFVMGHVVYIDEANVRRHTAFRRRFDPKTQRFSRREGDELDYAD